MTAPTRRVLEVDDVAGIRMLVKAALADATTDVLEALSGLQAIEIAREHRPHLIYLDLALPGMSGVDILRTLRSEEETRGIPVVIVTAFGHSDLARQAVEAGADALIEKPFRPIQLRALLDQWTTSVPPERAA